MLGPSDGNKLMEFSQVRLMKGRAGNLHQMERRLIFTTSEDCFYDYRLYEYNPKKSFVEKLRSVNLLYNSFECESKGQIYYDLVEHLQREIGMKQTVFGVKKFKDSIVWEYYFYNYRKEKPDITVTNLQNVLRRFYDFNFSMNEKLPYFMFSMDIRDSFFENKMMDECHLYTMGQSNHSSGFSYSLSSNGILLENYYSFFFPDKEPSELVSKIKNSMIVDFNVVSLHDILLPALAQCKQICVANKNDADCIYYCGINIDQFIYFLRMFEYPDKILNFVESKSQLLNHLEFDVGYDYQMKNGKLSIVKSGYYGTF